MFEKKQLKQKIYTLEQELNETKDKLSKKEKENAIYKDSILSTFTIFGAVKEEIIAEIAEFEKQHLYKQDPYKLIDKIKKLLERQFK